MGGWMETRGVYGPSSRGEARSLPIISKKQARTGTWYQKHEGF